MNALQCWQKVQEWLLKNQTVIIILVVNSTKGSPGNAGQMMAITYSSQQESVVIGTIGGGIMERRIFDELTQALRHQQKTFYLPPNKPLKTQSSARAKQ